VPFNDDIECTLASAIESPQVERRRVLFGEPLYGETPARRIYFLELIAWAIHHVESFHTREEATEFGQHLTETREAVWGEGKPWLRAADSGKAYLDHVRAMADVFAHAASAEEALYPNREHQPIA
jgi:hypothetical protein